MKFAIIGLGQFGSQLAAELAAERHEVVAIDQSERIIEAIKDKVDYAVVLDACDKRALEQAGVADMDAVVVAIGEDFAASLIVAGHLQEIKVKRLLCRSLNPTHDRLLRLMKVDEIVQAEEMAARQLAKRLGIRGAARHFALGEEHAIVELPVLPEFVGQTLAAVELRAKHGLNLVTVKRKPSDQELAKNPEACSVLGVPEPTTKFQQGDCLIVFGRENALKRYAAKMEE